MEISVGGGRGNSFEITYNDFTVYSKLKTGAFPDREPLFQALKKCAEGNLTACETDSPSCSVM